MLGGGFLHSVIPHSHEGGSEVAWQSMHGAVRHEEKELFLTLAYTLFILVPLALLLSSRRNTIFGLYGLELAASYSGRKSLRRGIEKYRRFG